MDTDTLVVVRWDEMGWDGMEWGGMGWDSFDMTETRITVRHAYIFRSTIFHLSSCFSLENLDGHASTLE